MTSNFVIWSFEHGAGENDELGVFLLALAIWGHP